LGAPRLVSSLKSRLHLPLIMFDGPFLIDDLLPLVQPRSGGHYTMRVQRQMVTTEPKHWVGVLHERTSHHGCSRLL